ncbi:MAG TPA: hypothetical protein VLD38_00455 [Nitrosopumilaceae archaeon]|nr:hypothetical protein [Nitrosopumilaceae archaeon]
MKWEVPLLLGFLLFFSTWNSLPFTNSYYFDSNNTKHYILTSGVSSYHNDVDSLTNVLFIKYEDPWNTPHEISVVLSAGIFLVLLVHESIQFYLKNKILTLSKFNLKKYLNRSLNEPQNLDVTLQHPRDNSLSNLSLKHSLFVTKKLKSSKVFYAFFSLLILFSFCSQSVYAITAQFVDGGQLTGLSIDCASRSTVATLNTSLAAASSSTPNIIIATTDYVSSDSNTEQVDVSSGLYRGGTVRSQLQYPFFIGASNDGNHYTYLFEDATAGANPTYTIESCLAATAGNAESKILAIQGLESSFTDSGNVGTTAGSFVTIATLTTDLTTNNHIIIAQVQIDFDGSSTIAAGDIELRNGADTMLAENQFEIRGANGAVSDGSAITLISVIPAGSANTSYKIAIREPAGGGVAGAEAKILALKAGGGEGYFTDGGSVSVAASATQLTSLASSFSNNEKIVVISASQFDDTDSGTENLIITSGHEIRENGVAKSGNQMAITEQAASGNAGEGIRHTLIWYGSAGGASLSYESRAQASATGFDGESKLLAFSVQENLSPSDTPTLSESVTLKQNLSPSDTPTLSESVTLKQRLFSDDTPSISDSATVSLTHNISADDTPTLSESVTLKQNLSPSDTPTLSESVTLKQRLFSDDTPSISDSATVSLIQGLTANDTPTLSESVTLAQILFTNDILSPSDSATVASIQGLTTNETPTISDSATVSLIQGTNTNDTPILSESVILKQSLFTADNLSINDIATLHQENVPTGGGGGGGDHNAPSIGSSIITSLGDSKSGLGVIIGENNDLNNLSSGRPINIGEKINLKFEINDDQGINNIAHASLYIGNRTSESEISESDTYIRFEKGKPFEVSDPHKLFSDVSFALLTKDTNNFVLRFDLTFAKTLEKSSILFRTWDLSRNANQVLYFDALEVKELDTSLPPTTLPDAQNSTENQNLSGQNGSGGIIRGLVSAGPRLDIEKWAGYNQESISDFELLMLLGIISSQQPGENVDQDNHFEIVIPSWYKHTVAKWLLDGKISYTEFVNALEYMYEKRIIQ